MASKTPENSDPNLDSNYISKAKVICDDMIYYCFDVLHSILHKKEEPGRPSFTNREFPLFVTWYKGKDLDLRGCIGTFSPLSLHDGLKEYALTSALRDTRFNPIHKDELSDLNCSVSLLTNFEPGSHWKDWQIGKHGIRIEFPNERGSIRSATYLPEIAHEQNWNHTQTIDSLLRKGGYKAKITDELRDKIALTRYQSEKMTKSFHDWIKRFKGSNS